MAYVGLRCYCLKFRNWS